MERDPKDARAPYYLGNLLMDIQPEAAIEAWKTAEKLDPSFAMVHRNLGWAAARRDATLDNAITEYEKAIAADPKEPVFYYELDRVYEVANTDPQKRYAMLDAHRHTLARHRRGGPYRIAPGAALDERRKRRPTAELPELPADDGRPAYAELDHLTGDLPATERAAVVLRYGYDLDYADIATALGSSEDAARQAASSGVRRLRRRMT